MDTYNLIMFFLYFGALIFILPSSHLSFDLYERRFRLFPHWFSFVAIAWLIVSVVLGLILTEINRNEFIIANLNFSLFLSFFSKQKFEDEFSDVIRFKAFTYSFVSVVAMIGAFSFQVHILDGKWTTYFLIQFFLGTGFLIATLYFYLTLYKLRKENN